jgi:hypothetical protein
MCGILTCVEFRHVWNFDMCGILACVKFRFASTMNVDLSTDIWLFCSRVTQIFVLVYLNLVC